MKSFLKELNDPKDISTAKLTIRFNLILTQIEMKRNEMIRLVSSVLQFLNS
jgi:hypothetical protein